jgi:hypothetical protein
MPKKQVFESEGMGVGQAGTLLLCSQIVYFLNVFPAHCGAGSEFTLFCCALAIF